ncbi:MAG: lytic transglycosylase domain-containing protein [Neisseriaceae bacterium]|nr:lytic transglycosylase domain-containing protein [Neisseriaceae bacterium]MBP6862676.1 lytic transglycosylase domain-containing protein [Neisseriaceae bacterium]
MIKRLFYYALLGSTLIVAGCSSPSKPGVGKVSTAYSYNHKNHVQSYLDPEYDRLELMVGLELNIDPRLIGAIRVAGERSNANQISRSGARTVYQILPKTRAAIIKLYKVDPYQSSYHAALGAGYLLKENLMRNQGNVDAAVGEYNSGLYRENWTQSTQNYRQRVQQYLNPL